MASYSASQQEPGVQQALQEGEHQYLTHFHLQTYAIILCRSLRHEHGQPADFVNVAVTGAASKLLGLDPADIEGRRLSEVLPEIEPARRELLADSGMVMHGADEPAFDLFHLPTRRWLSVYACDVAQDRIAVLLSDITGQKQVEQERQRLLGTVNHAYQERRLLAAAFDTLHEGIAVFNMKGEIVLENAAQAGVSAIVDMAAPRKIHSFFLTRYEMALPRGEPLPVEEWPLSRVLRGEIFSDWDLQIHRPDTGRSWQFRFSGAPVFDEQGQQMFAILVSSNITARKRRQAGERRKSMPEAAETEAVALARRTFFDSLSHELRTPLNSMIGFTGLLLRGPLSKEQRGHAELARTSGEILLHLINDLLDFSMIDADLLELNVAEFSPVHEVEKTLALVHKEARGKSLSLHWHIQAPRQVRGDARRLCQILFNLLDNALKFTLKGRVTLTCEELRSDNSEVWLRFTVMDTGIGISPAVQGRIFEPFLRADASSTRRCGGTGLGLAVCSRLAGAMGGSIAVSSVVDAGSTFTVELPFELVTRGGEVLWETSLSTPEPPKGNARQRVLVVEDSQVSQLMVATLLERAGYWVDVASNGQEAVAATLAQHYDLVLMDCEMPVMDGFEATRTIRRAEPSGQHLPIIATTALTMKGDREKCLAAGMDDYLAKPLHFKDLCKMVDLWLKGHQHGHRPEHI
jgi:signal transduction histidine kinase/ActR/RegA family two-component response regulator